MKRSAVVGMLIVVLVFVAAPGLLAGSNKVNDAVKGAEGLATLLGTVAIIAGAYFRYSPKQAKIADKLAYYGVFLTGNRAKELFAILDDLSHDVESRRQRATKFVMADTAGTPWQMSEAEARKFVDYVTSKYRQGRESIQKVLRKE